MPAGSSVTLGGAVAIHTVCSAVLSAYDSKFSIGVTWAVALRPCSVRATTTAASTAPSRGCLDSRSMRPECARSTAERTGYARPCHCPHGVPVIPLLPALQPATSRLSPVYDIDQARLQG